ncbi:hypothetical protein LMG27177_07337 [Paraburkholderia fynbosensis]|uniref:Uncharacterized protein n=1 Tax=Paraburkholderia fynbosensis TaxID=1200993 RepID=A0A6J5H2N7_9BURK|nr:hypothetical protein LMG27177_07337 [Paraburkholderia fynbosensis]
MENVFNVVLQSGRSAIDVSLYTLVPVMVVMMILLQTSLRPARSCNTGAGRPTSGKDRPACSR